MPDNEGFVHDLLFPDSNTRRFHAGDACQWSPTIPEEEVEPAVAAMIQAHRDSIHAPGSRSSGQFGLDDDGVPIETSYLGVGVDPETGATFALDNDGNRVETAASKAAAATASKRERADSGRSQPADKPSERPAAAPSRSADR
jgi:hypothetical protein